LAADGCSAPCGAELFLSDIARPATEELRSASGRAGTATGASRASRTPWRGTLFTLNASTLPKQPPEEETKGAAGRIRPYRGFWLSTLSISAKSASPWLPLPAFPAEGEIFL
ncbi:MAG: hypothetical protein ABIT37_23745, partial [Luteolibacter sp.]